MISGLTSLSVQRNSVFFFFSHKEGLGHLSGNALSGNAFSGATPQSALEISPLSNHTFRKREREKEREREKKRKKSGPMRPGGVLLIIKLYIFRRLLL